MSPHGDADFLQHFIFAILLGHLEVPGPRGQDLAPGCAGTSTRGHHEHGKEPGWLLEMPRIAGLWALHLIKLDLPGMSMQQKEDSTSVCKEELGGV